MTLTIETGAGVREANAYVSASYVTTYLTNRGRETDWSALTTTEQEAAIIAATDYIEKRFGSRFLGYREFSFDAIQATGSINFTGQPDPAETITIGTEVYVFVSSLTAGNENEVLIGATASDTEDNLYDAITANASTAGTTYTARTEANRHVTVEKDGLVLELTATADGASGNFTTLTDDTAPPNITLTSFSGGKDGGSQPLSWPRLGVYDRSGRQVLGVPVEIKEAVAEYADRARSALLAPDPNVDAQGGSIIRLREKVGPIETETEYSEGTHLGITFKPYPAADALIFPFLLPAGRAVR